MSLQRSETFQTGQVLLIVLWVMGLLSIAIGALVERATHELRLGQIPLTLVQHRAIAQASIQQAITLIQHDDANVDTLTDCGSTALDGVDNDRPLRNVVVGEGTFSIGTTAEGTFCAGVIDEERKLNLRATSTVTADVLRRLIATVGSEGTDAAAMANAIVDWQDEAVGTTCAQAHPACHNGLMDSVDELRAVPGMSPALFDAIVPYVTVYGSGAVNVNTASAVVLSALGYPADQLIAQRKSQPFDAAHPAPPGLVTSSTTFRIPVEVRVGNETVPIVIDAIVDRQGHIRAYTVF